jgi:hypothetical protein
MGAGGLAKWHMACMHVEAVKVHKYSLISSFLFRTHTHKNQHQKKMGLRKFLFGQKSAGQLEEVKKGTQYYLSKFDLKINFSHLFISSF